MNRMQNKFLSPIARQNRNRMTMEERKLWYDFLRKHPVKFRRQKVLGLYIADFYSFEAKLVIEVDGDYHSGQYTTKQDVQRTKYLQNFGLLILRVSNEDINRDFEKVCKRLQQEIDERMKTLGQQSAVKPLHGAEMGSLLQRGAGEKGGRNRAARVGFSRLLRLRGL